MSFRLTARRRYWAQTQSIAPEIAQTYLERVLAASEFVACKPPDDVIAKQAPALPPHDALALRDGGVWDGDHAASVSVEFEALARRPSWNARRVLGPDTLAAALSLLNRLGAEYKYGGVRLSVMLPTTTYLNPTQDADVRLSIGSLDSLPDGLIRDGQRRFGMLSVSVAHRMAYREPRLGTELAAEYDRVLRAVGLADDLAVGLDHGPARVLDAELAPFLDDVGHVVLAVRNPDTLCLFSDVRRVGGRRAIDLQREALANGRRVVKVQSGPGGEGRNFSTLTISDPSNPFTTDDARAVLDLWSGRVYGGDVGFLLSRVAYDGLRAEMAVDDPFGQWSVAFRSLGVRDVAALEGSGLRPSLFGEFGVGSVALASGERLDIVLAPEDGSFRLRAYAYSRRTDVPGEFGDLLGDPSLIDP